MESDEDALFSCGDEVIRRSALATPTKENQQPPPTFWETRLETFAANIDTLAEVVQGRGRLGITIRHHDDDKQEINETLALTI